ncbi:MAG: formate--tetrahydrofolate ligase [Oscillospiraceae bacterium]
MPRAGRQCGPVRRCGPRAARAASALAEEVIRLCEQENHFRFAYELEQPIEDKLAAIVKKVYHGDGVVLTPAAKKQVKQLTELGCGDLPICMAKTQYSFSDDQTLLGAPERLHGHGAQSEGAPPAPASWWPSPATS